MNRKDHHQENQTAKTDKVASTQIPLLKDVVDLLVQHGSDGAKTGSNPKQGPGRSKPAAKKVISRGPADDPHSDTHSDPHYDPDTLDLFSDVYNSVKNNVQEHEELENTINRLVDQYAQTVVNKLNADLIEQLTDLSACLSDTNTSETVTTDDDND
ncbi:MAG: hypothetical protein HOL98_13175 [Gammaproteobacteria bacterium]|jgi:hypothetical protein|nr:hypothetical protein [Gammaproteobacteria bacterium]MBT6246757.1 hypothetical protein [Gammaproteobacteria bacterium]